MEKQKLKKIIISSIILVAALAFILVLAFGTSVKINVNDTDIYVKCFTENYQINISDVKDLKLLDSAPDSKRVVGIGLSTLKLGTYTCDTYGQYKRATHDKSDSKYIFIETNESEKYLFNCKTVQETEEIYNRIFEIRR